MRNLKFASVAILVLLLINFFRPVAEPKFFPEYAAPSTGSVVITWPSAKQVAIGAQDYGILESSGRDKPLPIASIAKVLTAMAVLQKKPTTTDQPGPTITFTQADVDIYKKVLAQNGSVVPVAEGERLSQYQALQAMMIPSGNNIADSIAKWAFGSTDAYLIYVNKMVKQLGMNNTTVTDPSGFDPKTVSTAHDLVLLGLAVQKDLRLSAIINQKSVKLPVAGQLTNTNYLLGIDGIDGIKTGHTDQSGGCFLFSATKKVEGKMLRFVGAVVGAAGPTEAIDSAPGLVDQMTSGFSSLPLARAGQTVGYYKTAWDKKVQVGMKGDFKIIGWRGSELKPSFNLAKTKKMSAGDKAGTLNITAGDYKASAELVAQDKLSNPPFFWRLFRL